MVNKYPSISGAGIFDINLENTSHEIFEDLDSHYDKNKIIYLYKGERKTNYDEKFYNIYLRYRKYEYDYIMLDYTDEKIDVSAIPNHLKTFLDFITEK